MKRIRGRGISTISEIPAAETTKICTSSGEEIVGDKKYTLNVTDESSETFARC